MTCKLEGGVSGLSNYPKDYKHMSICECCGVEKEKET